MRSVLLSTITGWIARALAIAVNLIGLPLALQALGSTRFGVMLIAMSIGSWVGIFNIGIGRMVANLVARYMHRSQPFVRETVSQLAVVSLRFHVIVFLLCSAVLLALAGGIDLGPNAVDYKPDFLIGTIAIFFFSNLWFFLSLFEGIDAGQHQLFRLAGYQILGYSAMLVVLLTLFKHMPSLVFASILLSSGFLIGNVAHAIDVWTRHRCLFARKGRLRRSLGWALLGSGASFTVISVVLSIMFQYLPGIFGLMVGPDAIINLAVFMRILIALAGVIFTMTYPMSNLIAARVANRDVRGAAGAAAWTAAGLLAVVAPAAIGFQMFGERLMSIWLRAPVVYEPSFLAMASLLIFDTAFYAYATGVAIGFGRTVGVARIHVVQGVAIMPLAYAGYLVFGQAGILMAMNLVLVAGGVCCLGTGSQIRLSRSEA